MCIRFLHYSSLHVHIALYALLGSLLGHLWCIVESHIAFHELKRKILDRPSNVFSMCASAKRQVALHGILPYNKPLLLYCSSAYVIAKPRSANPVTYSNVIL